MDALFHGDTLGSLLIRFIVNLVFLFILVILLYFRYTKKEKFLFTFFPDRCNGLLYLLYAEGYKDRDWNRSGIICNIPDSKVQNKELQCKRYGLYLHNNRNFCY